MKQKSLFLVCALLILLPVIYLIKVYPALPGIIPTHFRLDGKPNAFGEKTTLIWTIAILSVLGVITCLLFGYMPRIDPKLRKNPATTNYSKIALVTAAVISAVQVMIIYGTVSGALTLTKMPGAFIGIAICLFGNFMYNVKPNYFFGIRVPWTLESDDNWRATHRLAGKLWFFGGLVISACCLLFPAVFRPVILLVILFILAFVPMTYSFVYFRRHQ